MLDVAPADFATAYRVEVDRDHAAPVTVVKSGRIRAANEAEPEIHSDLPGWQDLSPEPAAGEQ